MNCAQTRDWLAQQAVEPTSPLPEALAHLETCPACQAAQAGLASLGSWRSEEPPLGLSERTLRAIREQAPPEFWVDRWLAALTAWLHSRHPLTAAAMVGMLFVAVLAPNWLRGRAQGAMTACQANLHTLSLALDDHAGKHHGQYPKTLEELKLQALPRCPSADAPTYALQVSPDGLAYTVYCSGNHHGEPDQPRYSRSQAP